MKTKAFLTYYSEIHAAYFKLRDGKIEQTIEAAPEIFIDLGRDKKIIGVEMLHPGKVHIRETVSLSKRYNEPMLKRINPSQLEKVFASK